MQANVGGLDRVLRIAIGLVLLGLVAFIDSDARWWGLVGLVPLLTGLLGHCPLYSVFRVKTCPAAPRG